MTNTSNPHETHARVAHRLPDIVDAIMYTHGASPTAHTRPPHAVIGAAPHAPPHTRHPITAHRDRARPSPRPHRIAGGVRPDDVAAPSGSAAGRSVLCSARTGHRGHTRRGIVASRPVMQRPSDVCIWPVRTHGCRTGILRARTNAGDTGILPVRENPVPPASCR